MTCPNCSFENQVGARFCQNCGQSLSRICDSCGTTNLQNAKFCINCGSSVESGGQVEERVQPGWLSVDPRLERLATATPDLLAEKMRSATALSGERRVVTALFADVVGSTAIAEQLDPEDWTAVMNRAFDLLLPVIYRYEGTIARLMGDAVLSFFGAPVTHEDDPVRAVKAALELVAVSQEYAREVRQEYGVEFAIRVGLNTGPVVVGDVGSNLIYEYTAMGDAVNLAARMQAAARPMSVWVTENTYRFIGPFFNFEDQGLIAVKGRAGAVKAYEVTGLLREPGRLRGLEGLVSPLVGREPELAALLNAHAVLRAGLGRVVVVTGEAGIGKSRLIAEWQSAVLAANPGAGQFATGRCLSYGQNLPYHLLIDLLRSLVGVPGMAGQTETQDALHHLVSQLGLDNGEVYPYLAHLLSLQLDEKDQERLQQHDPQALQTRTLNSFRILLTAASARSSLAFVLEDIHWADPSSISLLKRLLPLIKEVPLLFCLVARPERDTFGWKLISEIGAEFGAGLIELNLVPLSEDESCELVSNLLEMQALLPVLREHMLSKTEGNPLFVEEVIRTLIDRGILEKTEFGWRAGKGVENLKIPDTVQGLVLSRIDRLPEDVKHSLRVAAVIGRQFSLKVLQYIAKDQGTASVNRLEAAGLLTLAAVQPELEYTFRHTFFHEAAYASLVKKDRQWLHLQVGEALEGLYPERLEEFAPRLAAHYDRAGEIKRALRFYILAGESAARVYANHEAVINYSRALEIILSMPDQMAAEYDLRELFLYRGRVLELMARYEDALQNYLAMEARALSSADPVMELAAVMGRVTLYSTPTPLYDFNRGQELTARALQLADQLGDQAAEARINWHLLLRSYFEGNFDDAAIYGERSLELARAVKSKELLAYTLADTGNFVYLSKGEFARALSALREAVDLFKELNNLPMLADTLTALGLLYYFMGEFEKALSITTESLEISLSIGNLWGQAFSLGSRSIIHVDLGNISTALSGFEESLQLGREAGFLAIGAMGPTFMAFLLASLGDHERALGCAIQGVANSEEGSTFWLNSALGGLAMVHTHIGNQGEAQKAFDRAREKNSGKTYNLVFDIFLALAECEAALSSREYGVVLVLASRHVEALRSRGARNFLPHALYFQGKALMGQGKLDEAAGYLEDACREAEEIGSRLLLWQILALRVVLESQRGNWDDANQIRLYGQEEVQYLASKIQDNRLSQIFWSHPNVRLLMNREGTDQ